MKHTCFALLLILLNESHIHSQNTGIGITTPRAPLHVFTGASGNLFPYSPLVVESDNNSYVNILTPNARESGILFGNFTDAASGGIIYNNTDPLPGNPNGLQFRTNGNITRMVLTSTGNVGIGLPTPTERLDVAGIVRAQSFKYSTPKQTYHSIPGIAFLTTNINDTLTLSVGNGTATPFSLLNTKTLLAPVQLPDKAVMQDITVYFIDNSASANFQIVFYRKTITSNFFPDNIGSTVTSGSSTTPVPYTIPVNTFGSSNVIDNTLYTYYITVTSFDSFPWVNNNGVAAAIIRYTMDEPIK